MVIGLPFIIVIVGDKYNYNPDIVLVIAVVACIVGAAIFFYCIVSSYQPPDPTGEIIKLYANGTALVDNGSLIQIKDIYCVRCP